MGNERAGGSFLQLAAVGSERDANSNACELDELTAISFKPAFVVDVGTYWRGSDGNIFNEDMQLTFKVRRVSIEIVA